MRPYPVPFPCIELEVSELTELPAKHLGQNHLDFKVGLNLMQHKELQFFGETNFLCNTKNAVCYQALVKELCKENKVKLGVQLLDLRLY